MITHEMGNAIPPANKHPRMIAWVSKQPGEPPTNKTMMMPTSMAVRDGLRDTFWCAQKMHVEFAAACQAANVALPIGFVIVLADEVIGYGAYNSDDAHDRAFADVAICEREWECRGRGRLPRIGVDLSGIPDEQQIALARRTGAPMQAMVTKQ